MVQSPDLNMIEILWKDLERVLHKQIPVNLHQLKQYCKVGQISSTMMRQSKTENYTSRKNYISSFCW